MELLPAGAGRRQVIGCLPASFAFFPSVWQAPGKHLANARFVCYKKTCQPKSAAHRNYSPSSNFFSNSWTHLGEL